MYVLGVPAQAFDSWNLGMLTSSEFGNAEVCMYVLYVCMAGIHIIMYVWHIIITCMWTITKLLIRTDVSYFNGNGITVYR